MGWATNDAQDKNDYIRFALLHYFLDLSVSRPRRDAQDTARGV